MTSRVKINVAQIESEIASEAALLMQKLSAAEPNWDALIVGDGSGTNWNQPCAWAAILFDRHLGRHKKVKGGMDCGTSYLAELLPYVQVLSWYLEGHGKHILKTKQRENPKAHLNIHVVTDNETIAKQGRGNDEMGRKVGSYYWAMFDDMETSRNVNFTWHHMGRMTTQMNKLCDYLAGEQRKAMLAINGNSQPPPQGQAPE